MTRGVVFAGAAWVVGAIAATRLIANGQTPLVAITDAATGVVLLVATVIAWRHPASHRIGMLVAATWVTWIAGAASSNLVLLHRGPLVHLLLSFPTGRVRWIPAAVAITMAYTASIVDNDALALVTAAAVAFAAGVLYTRASGTPRRAGLPAVSAGLVFAAVLAFTALSHVASWRADRPLLLLYDVAVAGVVSALVANLTRAGWAEAVVTNLVVDLGGPSGTTSLRQALGRALGDPGVVLGYWLAEEERFVDDHGRTVDPADPGPSRITTRVTTGALPLAVLIHDDIVRAEPSLLQDIAAAARLALANARMQAETRTRVDAIAASRRRIVEAAEAQQQRFERELTDSVQRRLANVADLLAGSRRAAPQSSVDAIDGLTEELTMTRAEVDELARGIHPRVLTEDGLAAAIAALPTPVACRVGIAVDMAAVAPAVEAAVYYVCSEALANVAKHAHAQMVSVVVSEHRGIIEATIEDDGCGGANLTAGSGLRGLTDRVEAFGGRLTVDPRRGGGTSVHAWIPTRRALLSS